MRWKRAHPKNLEDTRERQVTDVSALWMLPELERANIRSLNLPKEHVDALRARLRGQLYD